MSTPHQEQHVTLELEAAVNGRPLPSEVYKEVLAADISAALLDGRSGNILLVGKVVGLWAGAPVRDELVVFLVASQKTHMGDEQGTTIYGPLHVGAVAGIHLWAVRHADVELAELALGWLRFWVGFYRLCRTSSGVYLTVGNRSGGHDQTEDMLTVPDAGWIAYVMAAAEGEALPLGLVKELKLGPASSWIPGCVAGVETSLRAAGSDPRPMPAYGLLSPVHVFAGPDGHAVVVLQEGDGNNNTPAILAAAVLQGKLVYLPAHGGVHVRGQATHGTCGVEGGQVVYRSTIHGQEEMRFDLPPGLVETVIGSRGQVPTVDRVSPAHPPSQVTDASTLDPHLAEDFAFRLSALRLGRGDSGTRISILAKLHPGLPSSELASLADQIAAFGIGAGQPQFHLQQDLVGDMRAACSR